MGYTDLPRSTKQRHREDDMELSLQRLSLNSTEATLRPDVDSQDIVEEPSSNETTTGIENTQESIFQSILGEYHSRLASFTTMTANLERNSESILKRGGKEMMDLQEHISWMTSTMYNLKTFHVRDSDSLDQQRSKLVHALQEKLEKLRHWEESRYDAGRKDREKGQGCDTSIIDNEKNFKHSLTSCHPLVLLSMFISVVLHVIQELPERSTNFLLQMHHDLVKLTFALSGAKDLTEERKLILKRFPKDVRTVRSRFGLDTKIQIFAACPNCSALSEPILDVKEGFNVYPAAYCSRKEINGMECGAALLKWQVRGTQTIKVPRRPYGFHSLHDFVGEMLSRPGLEDLLERQPLPTQPVTLTDIFDGKVIRDFKGSDGQPCFCKNGHSSDLYLAWAMCVDWFNPFHNKTAGKTVSVGMVSMICLNLPLQERNNITNMYLAGIIPGPREPSLHRVNHFLAPLIDELSNSWRRGTQYSRTYKFLNGRTVYCILIPLVADLPASRKVSGTAGHGSRCFCPLCLRKKDEIYDISVSFNRRTRDEHIRLAKQWRDAKTANEQINLVKKNGVRDSVLFTLPYWEPYFIVVDAMHNLFLGLVKHHFRKIIGIDYEKSSKRRSKRLKGDGISAKNIGKILGILKNPQGPTASQLKRFSIDDLVDFHICQQISLSLDDDSFRKDRLVLSLLNCNLVEKNQSESSSGEGNMSVIPVEEDVLPFFDVTPTSASPEPQITGHPGASTSNRKSKPKSFGRIDATEIEAIQVAISNTCRPSWQQGLPKTFGLSQQGKLKADQWRTLLEFDLPIALVDLWVDSSELDSTISIATKERRMLLVDITMELAIAVSWGTSRRTSVDHAAKYILHLQRYLQGLQKLSPRPKLVPNHHSALHIGEQLLLFGPVDGWWTFPYERLIGRLQNINTNGSVGEMELTMLKSHLASARLQRLFRSSDCPSVLQDYIATFDSYFPAHAPRKNSSNISQSSNLRKNTGASSERKLERLDDDIYEAVCLLLRGSEQTPNRAFFVHKYHIVGGTRYTSLESERDSIIFYGRGDNRYPGVIRKIFSLSSGEVIFAVHPYLERGRDISDPFTRWPEFRASIWSQKVDEKVELVNPDDIYICHAARRPWKGQGLFVLRAIDRNY